MADRDGQGDPQDPTRRIHYDAQRLKILPDRDAHQGLRIDNLYQQQPEARKR